MKPPKIPDEDLKEAELLEFKAVLAASPEEADNPTVRLRDGHNGW